MNGESNLRHLQLQTPQERPPGTALPGGCLRCRRSTPPGRSLCSYDAGQAANKRKGPNALLQQYHPMHQPVQRKRCGERIGESEKLESERRCAPAELVQTAGVDCRSGNDIGQRRRAHHGIDALHSAGFAAFVNRRGRVLDGARSFSCPCVRPLFCFYNQILL
jgi:hypothetical protein